jgi:hypothetical protein
MEVLTCVTTDCAKPGVLILPGVALCRYHRKRGYHALCEIYHSESERTFRDKEQALKEIHEVAVQASGWTSPPEFLQHGWGDEMSGGLPSLGKGQ